MASRSTSAPQHLWDRLSHLRPVDDTSRSSQYLGQRNHAAPHFEHRPSNSFIPCKPLSNIARFVMGHLPFRGHFLLPTSCINSLLELLQDLHSEVLTEER
jgi:hypothetical protein